jgi:hypothetical protein
MTKKTKKQRKGKEIQSKQFRYQMLAIRLFLHRVIKGLPKKDSKQFISLINKFYDLPKQPKFMFVYDILHTKSKKIIDEYSCF